MRSRPRPKPLIGLSPPPGRSEDPVFLAGDARQSIEGPGGDLNIATK